MKILFKLLQIAVYIALLPFVLIIYVVGSTKK